MSPLQTVSLLLAVSTAVNIGIVTGLLARRSGTGPQAILSGAGATATTLSLYFAALATYK
ncbi:hypothetical protein ABT373_37355 [Streptomyces sp. NPDC000070]|uniref:hypothetical protein n=1 Tax=Streptomyces sp. NPDC000070 TaxID=3154240 RepID=UPI0033207AE9